MSSRRSLRCLPTMVKVRRSECGVRSSLVILRSLSARGTAGERALTGISGVGCTAICTVKLLCEEVTDNHFVHRSTKSLPMAEKGRLRLSSGTCLAIHAVNVLLLGPGKALYKPGQG